MSSRRTRAVSVQMARPGSGTGRRMDGWADGRTDRRLAGFVPTSSPTSAAVRYFHLVGRGLRRPKFPLLVWAAGQHFAWWWKNVSPARGNEPAVCTRVRATPGRRKPVPRPRPCAGSPGPWRPQGRQLPAPGHCRAASRVGTVFQARVRAGARAAHELVGNLAVTSPRGPGFLGPGRLSEERLGLWGLARVWVVS